MVKQVTVVPADRQSINVRRGNRILEITSVSASGIT